MVRWFILLMLVGIMSGCSGGILTEKMFDYDALIDEGWEHYNKNRYDDASLSFINAKKMDDTRPEAYIGCGWTLLRKQHPDSAVVVFRTSFDYITGISDSLDALCGLAGSYLAYGKDTNVVNLFKQYEMSYYKDSFPLRKHDMFLDTGDLEVVQAMAYYRLGLYSASESADPDNAVFHLNQALLITYEYTDPQSLMKKMIEYREQSEGDYHI